MMREVILEERMNGFAALDTLIDGIPGEPGT